MPVTIPIPEFLDPDKKSVFDPLHEQVMRRMAETLGSDDPSSMVGDMINPMAAPAAGLISKIPFDMVPIRNKELLDIVSDKAYPQAVRNAVEYAAKKYPRILAHVQSVEMAPKLGMGVFGSSRNLGPLTDININPRASITGILQGTSPNNTMVETFGHELTHAAQNIWNKKDFPLMYDMSEDVWGYKNNIFESGARNAGRNFREKVKAEVAKSQEPGVIQKLIDMFNLSK